MTTEPTALAPSPEPATHDVHGRPYAKLSELHIGDLVDLDDGFTCRRAGPAVVQDYGRGTFFFCDCGHHYLAGQADDGEHCVGVYRAVDES